jgi:hypothetical protein
MERSEVFPFPGIKVRVLPCIATVFVARGNDMGIFIGVSLGRKYIHNLYDSQNADHHSSQHCENDDLFIARYVGIWTEYLKN